MAAVLKRIKLFNQLTNSTEILRKMCKICADMCRISLKSIQAFVTNTHTNDNCFVILKSLIHLWFYYLRDYYLNSVPSNMFTYQKSSFRQYCCFCLLDIERLFVHIVRAVKVNLLLQKLHVVHFYFHIDSTKLDQ